MQFSHVKAIFYIKILRFVFYFGGYLFFLARKEKLTVLLSKLTVIYIFEIIRILGKNI